jgi:TatD DNase family protein
MLTDTHTHLYSEAFDQDRDQVMSRALAQGVDRFFIPAIDSQTTQAMYELERTYPSHVSLMMGLHPTSVKDDFEAELAHVAAELASRSFCAVGEIGIDLYWDKSTLAYQQEAFRRQIQWAKNYNLPIVIHCRDAFDEIFAILETESGPELRGIFHCFTGTIAQAKRAIEYNMLLGIGGVVTFKNGKIDQFLNEIPLSQIVLETDSPYLAPAPHRGKRNESSYLALIAQRVAEVYGCPVEEIAAATSRNAKNLFE